MAETKNQLVGHLSAHVTVLHPLPNLPSPSPAHYFNGT